MTKQTDQEAAEAQQWAIYRDLLLNKDALARQAAAEERAAGNDANAERIERMANLPKADQSSDETRGSIAVTLRQAVIR